MLVSQLVPMLQPVVTPFIMDDPADADTIFLMTEEGEYLLTEDETSVLVVATTPQ